MTTNCHVLLWVFLGISGPQICFAQFSPGELSHGHEKLSGMENCTQCHEVARTISNKNCLSCHKDVKASVDARRGLHSSVAAQQCSACHKEHKGRDARITLIDPKGFDHNLTGFVRTGKHASTDCANCHNRKNIRDPALLAIIAAAGHDTYRGLTRTCVSCHEDKHDNTVGKECQNCHEPGGWSPAKLFDHSRAKFKLVGKHTTVECKKCHTGIAMKQNGKPLFFTANSHDDCTPCHVSPHRKQFSPNPCASCHSPEDWMIPQPGMKLNHDATGFSLEGRHATVACEKCHKTGGKSSPSGSLKMPHEKCTDCHSDSHGGEFTQKYGGECGKCHTPLGFVPATFTQAAHATSRFPLNGAHGATPCKTCHSKGVGGRPIFRFASLRCESCHKDRHGGQFVREMAEKSCGACHSTRDWIPKNLDHSKTNFALVGKHAEARCAGCHKPKSVDGVQLVQYKGTISKCENCHRDVHMAQFASGGESNCGKCHQPVAWKATLFDHGTQSAFPLTGAHKQVMCRKCHPGERLGDSLFLRFKPMPTRCESCHAIGGVRQK